MYIFWKKLQEWLCWQKIVNDSDFKRGKKAVLCDDFGSYIICINLVTKVLGSTNAQRRIHWWWCIDAFDYSRMIWINESLMTLENNGTIDRQTHYIRGAFLVFNHLNTLVLIDYCIWCGYALIDYSDYSIQSPNCNHLNRWSMQIRTN